MSKEEIKALIAAKIAGQGTQVDLGGALPSILDAIVDALPEGGGNEPYIVQGVSPSADIDGALKVSPEEFASAKEAFLAGRVVIIPEIENGGQEIACVCIGYSPTAIYEEGEYEYEGLFLSKIDNLLYSSLIPQQ